MCGITGAVWSDPHKAIDASTLARMVAVLSHRGPDDQGAYAAAMAARPDRCDPVGVAMGHRRLAVIDPAGGQQPMANEDGTLWIVCNGEIYNHRQLRHRLQSAGHRFRTASDTEVLLHLYEEEGPGLLPHLNGMFAFALWDARQNQLLLARDRLGEKPLVYCEEPGRLLFASELKALLEVAGVGRQLDPAALDAYLTYQYVPHPRTIFRGLAKLPPAHYGLYRDGRMALHRYWQPDFQSQQEGTEDDYLAALRELMESSVRLRLESDVPLGAFLSGGIDSTIIVGLMHKLGGAPVRTFSIGFPVPEYDETHYARVVANRFGTSHHELRIEPDAVQILPRLVWHYDEPFGDSSAVPTWYVAQQTRAHVTVALTGDGGDELFAGYPRYRAVWLAGWIDRLPQLLRRLLSARFWQRLPASPRQKSLRRRLKRFLEAVGHSPQRRYLEWIAIFNEARRAELYSGDLLAQLPDEDPYAFLEAAFARASHRDAVTATSLADVLTYLPCDLLYKVDIAAMAHGLECRPPFLDHRVVELAARMPVGLKFRWGQGKRILRKAFADLLPTEIQRRAKMGFGVPLDHWFRGPLAALARDILLDPRTHGRGLFRPEAIAQLVDEHLAGRFDHSYRLWALLVLELWQRCWVD